MVRWQRPFSLNDQELKVAQVYMHEAEIVKLARRMNFFIRRMRFKDSIVRGMSWPYGSKTINCLARPKCSVAPCPTSLNKKQLMSGRLANFL